MKLIFSCGDVNGIGLEIFYKILNEKVIEDEIAICVNSKTLFEYFDLMKFDYEFFENKVRVNRNFFKIVECITQVNINFGEISKDSGSLCIESLDVSSELVKSNEYNALITLPIHKDALYLAGWEFIGHTDYLESKFAKRKTLMVLYHKKLRVVPATIHIPLKDVSGSLNQAMLLEILESLDCMLEIDFGIEDRKIAVLGLNPHAGENGSFGDEEIGIISPAIEKANEKGIKAFGPYPADGFFAFGEYNNYDALVSMYHDQGLIPLKFYANGGGVNFTSGLSIIRTSPDHGTAMAIAGKDVANIESTFEAMLEAKKIFLNRKKYARNV
jgi:4-hydroxythreonine-4-phosphate dehydrogenase